MKPERVLIEGERPTRHRASASDIWDAVIVGGDLAGLSAAGYLGRSHRWVLLIDAGESLARGKPTERPAATGLTHSIPGHAVR